MSFRDAGFGMVLSLEVLLMVVVEGVRGVMKGVLGGIGSVSVKSQSNCIWDENFQAL